MQLNKILDKVECPRCGVETAVALVKKGGEWSGLAKCEECGEGWRYSLPDNGDTLAEWFQRHGYPLQISALTPGDDPLYKWSASMGEECRRYGATISEAVLELAIVYSPSTAFEDTPAGIAALIVADADLDPEPETRESLIRVAVSLLNRGVPRDMITKAMASIVWAIRGEYGD